MVRRWKQPDSFVQFLRLHSKYYSFVYTYHYDYFIKLDEYVAKLIGMLLPVIW